MKLHEDKYSFLALLGQIHDVSGIRMDILEKDYYVCLILYELAVKQETLPAYFKGGTALYKAQKTIRRFSEDVDLTVDIDGCSNSQAKKRLELATKKYTCLSRTGRKELEDDRKGSITTVYDYAPAVTIDEDDPLQRFGYVKVEATSFTVSEPYTTLEIEPIIYTLSNEDQRKILDEQFQVKPFPVRTICMERIFADKVFAAEFYFERGMYFDVAKHLYDTSIMLDLPAIQNLISNGQELLRMMNYKRLEEERRTGSDLDTKKYHDFKIFSGFSANRELEEKYMEMQGIYVFGDNDIVPYEYVIQQWEKIKEIVYKLDDQNPK